MHQIFVFLQYISHIITAGFDNKLLARVHNIFYKTESFGELVTETISVCDRLFAEYFLCAYGRS